MTESQRAYARFLGTATAGSLSRSYGHLSPHNYITLEFAFYAVNRNSVSVKIDGAAVTGAAIKEDTANASVCTSLHTKGLKRFIYKASADHT